MRILLDTNVLIAAFVSHGACAELLEYCARRHELITSDFILAEFRRNLTAQFAIPRREANEAARVLKTHMTIVTPSDPGHAACRDPDDLPVLGTAVSGKCRCLVTGDKDLLTLGRFQEIDILSPADFWRHEAEVQNSA